MSLIFSVPWLSQPRQLQYDMVIRIVLSVFAGWKPENEGQDQPKVAPQPVSQSRAENTTGSKCTAFRDLEKGALEKGSLHKIVWAWPFQIRDKSVTMLRTLPLMHETKYR